MKLCERTQLIIFLLRRNLSFLTFTFYPQKKKKKAVRHSEFSHEEVLEKGAFYSNQKHTPVSGVLFLHVMLRKIYIRKLHINSKM